MPMLPSTKAMMFSFVVRNDDGVKEVATVQVITYIDLENNLVADVTAWNGEQAKQMKKLLADMDFDTTDPESWRRLPERLTGSRLWAERRTIGNILARHQPTENE